MAMNSGVNSKSYPIFCTNCGEPGHGSKQCLEPVTSFGTILFRIRGATPNSQADSLLYESGPIVKPDTLEYLLIQRRDSLGYIDIMRGKYRLGDTEYIITQLRGMTTAEQQKLLHEPFDQLWEGLWGPPLEGTNSYRHEKEQSRAKLDALRLGSNGTPPLADLLQTIGTGWATPEWGFPKGRREAFETEYACALREMWEETGLTAKDVVPIRNLEPIREVFTGSNRIQYCHKYFIFYVPAYTPITMDPTNEHMMREVGDIRWFSFEEALDHIRPQNTEKRAVLTRVAHILRNYCPLQIA